MRQYTLREHLLEIKKRFLIIFICFILTFFLCYNFKEVILHFFLIPLLKVVDIKSSTIIFTCITEAFFSYIKLSIFVSCLIVTPVICFQIYFFIAPALLADEKKITVFILFCSPTLFYIGSFFVVYCVMPQAWNFFLSYEHSNLIVPLVLYPKISEYINLVIQLTMAFGIAFQLPIIISMLSLLQFITSDFLKRTRRFAVVMIFIVSAILTPPDIISQIALAMPLILLYETSIVFCMLIENRRSENARYQMDKRK